jgi:hypothetical protein
MRYAIHRALMGHGFGEKIYTLQQQCLELREEAIKRLVGDDGFKAIQLLAGKLEGAFGSKAEDLAVNCGGPRINLNPFPYNISGYSSKLKDAYAFAKDEYDGLQPTRLWQSRNDLRLDLEADDELAKRIVAWAELMEALKKQIETVSRQTMALLEKITTVKKLTATWPEAMPIIEPILELYEVAEPKQLPAVTDLNATLGLPPSNDDTLELTEVAA